MSYIPTKPYNEKDQVDIEFEHDLNAAREFNNTNEQLSKRDLELILEVNKRVIEIETAVAEQNEEIIEIHGKCIEQKNFVKKPSIMPDISVLCPRLNNKDHTKDVEPELTKSKPDSSPIEKCLRVLLETNNATLAKAQLDDPTDIVVRPAKDYKIDNISSKPLDLDAKYHFNDIRSRLDNIETRLQSKEIVKTIELDTESANFINANEDLLMKFQDFSVSCITDNGGVKRWYKIGTKILHRENGPAVECPNGDKEWYINGKLHREDGPAIEDADGHKEWYIDGKLHRLDGPAVDWTKVAFVAGVKKWYKNGKLHRLDGPAVEYFNGQKEWYINNLLHRIDGPAYECASGNKEWYYQGVKIECYSQKAFDKWLNKQKKNVIDRTDEEIEKIENVFALIVRIIVLLIFIRAVMTL